MKQKIIKSIFVLIVAFLGVFLTSDVLEPAAQRMLFIFIFAALFWAMEIIPLFATSILVVLLEILLLGLPGGVLNMGPTDYQIFLLPFGSPIIMLFWGSFVIAAALHLHKVDEFLSRRMLIFYGNKPFGLMIGIMFVTGFLSMWMSNTATTAMMVAMFSPILRQIDESAPIRKGLILSIPFAANLGGIGTPIGTPPNAIAIGILADHGIHINFFDWVKVAFPLVIVLLFVAAITLFALYKPKVKELELKFPKESKLTPKGQMVLFITICTILLWLTSGFHKLPSAIIALMSAAVFISANFIGKEHLKDLDWDVLILMWGGLALGKGMELSGLTDWLVSLSIFQQEGFALVSIFAFAGMVLSTFMSNTATANLLIPIVMIISGESTLALAVSVALACSVGMALPVSTPPNAISYASGLIKTSDMIKAGSIISLISLILILFLIRMITGFYGI